MEAKKSAHFLVAELPKRVIDKFIDRVAAKVNKVQRIYGIKERSIRSYALFSYIFGKNA